MASQSLPERKTKIVATLGPASSREERIAALIRAGVDVLRLNFSHGSREEHTRTIQRIRRLSRHMGQPVAVLQDLQGPKIRTGRLQHGKAVQLAQGARFVITTRPVLGTAEEVGASYQGLPRDVQPGHRIFLSDGALELRVVKTTDTDVVTQVIYGGTLGENQGVNLPDSTVTAPAITDKDREDMALGVEHEVDYVALSFVRQAEDIVACHRELARLGASIPVIAKIEKAEAVENLDAILQVCEGVMVARGDLGVELSPERVPILQKRIIRRANERGVPVITATQMLESMVHHPTPTRAEASDVANAILDGTDAVMLSGETAIGKYPVEAVQTMVRIALEAETSGEALPIHLLAHTDQVRNVSHAARTLADELHVRYLVVFTKSGHSARLLSKERPRTPILAFSPDEGVCRRLALWHGVTPFRAEFFESTDALMAATRQHLHERGLVRPGDTVVFVCASPLVAQAQTNLVTVQTV